MARTTTTARRARTTKVKAATAALLPETAALPIEIIENALAETEIAGEATTMSLEEANDALEAIVGELEAYEEAPAWHNAIEEIGEAFEELPAQADTRTFSERFADVEPAARDAIIFDAQARIDTRIEKAKADGKAASIKNLERAQKWVAAGHVGRTMLAAGLADASFANRSWHEGSEFNVYAFQKLADISKGMAGLGMTNAVNIAVIKSMFALEKAGIPFDFDTAKAAASCHYPPARPGVRSHLTRHTVGAGTAQTQAGSTLHAMMALGMVVLGRGKNYLVTILDNDVTARLREAVADAQADEE